MDDQDGKHSGLLARSALDLEGVLYSFAHPVFDAEGPILGSLLRPGVVALVRSFTSLFYLAAGVIALYVAFGTSFRWVGWPVAAYFGWLIYRRAAKTDRLEQDVNRWRRNLTAIDGCVQELVSGHFDASEIARRLRDEEKNRLFVHTTIFTILQRSAALHEVKDASEPSAAGHRKPTQEEMEDWAFQRSSDLSLAELRAMKAGEVVHLIEKSYFCPSEKASIGRFEYRHDHVDEGSSSKFGYEVHGFRRLCGAQDWESYHFLASDKGSQTSSCPGTIKRLG